MLLRNLDGCILLAETTYKRYWDIPGGLGEEGESPGEAARGECREELGVDLTITAPACIRYAPGVQAPGNGVMFVFDAGITNPSTDHLTLQAQELRSVKVVAPDELAGYLYPVMVTRMLATIDGANSGTTIYVER